MKRPGPPIVTPSEVRERVALLRANDVPYRRIAAILNREGVTTARGRTWSQSTVYSVARSVAADERYPLPQDVCER